MNSMLQHAIVFFLKKKSVFCAVGNFHLNCCYLCFAEFISSGLNLVVPRVGVLFLLFDVLVIAYTFAITNNCSSFNTAVNYWSSYFFHKNFIFQYLTWLKYKWYQLYKFTELWCTAGNCFNFKGRGETEYLCLISRSYSPHTSLLRFPDLGNRTIINQ